ncbi:MAG: hypothetical protein QGH59_00805 [Gemmatimonadota bacterium]|jgi:hypothetical protein|nr:hypothetical protein [Gemmatimonadota bacterium]
MKIELVEGEEITYTFTVKKDGTAEDISSYTPTVYVHDDNAAVGTNRVDEGSTSWVTDGTDGQFTYTFTSANTLITESSDGYTDVSGDWAIKLDETSGTGLKWTKRERFVLRKNPFIAAT